MTGHELFALTPLRRAIALVTGVHMFVRLTVRAVSHPDATVGGRWRGAAIVAAYRAWCAQHRVAWRRR